MIICVADRLGDGALINVGLCRVLAEAMCCETQILCDAAPYHCDTTKDGISRALAAMNPWLAQGDYVALFVSCHGDETSMECAGGSGSIAMTDVYQSLNFGRQKPLLGFIDKCRTATPLTLAVEQRYAQPHQILSSLTSGQNMFIAYATVHGGLAIGAHNGSFWLNALARGAATVGCGGRTITGFMTYVRSDFLHASYHYLYPLQCCEESLLLPPWGDAVFLFPSTTTQSWHGIISTVPSCDVCNRRSFPPNFRV